MQKEEVKPLFEAFEQQLEKTLNHFKNELMMVRAGRANPQILSKITVDYYGTPTPLVSMANISIPEARMLFISLFDASMLKEVEKAILASDIGINPTNDGRNIRLVFPALTEERRKDLIKQIKKTAEDAKVVLRNCRRDAIEGIKKLKKDSVLSEDEEKQHNDNVQKILDRKTELVDKLLKEKESEIIEV